MLMILSVAFGGNASDSQIALEFPAGLHIFVKNQPEPLFDPAQDFGVPQGIVFIEEERELWKMTEEALVAFSEDLVSQSIAVADVDPETFDVPPFEVDEEDEELEAFNFVAGRKKKEEGLVAIQDAALPSEVRLTAEQLAELKRILEEQDTDITEEELLPPSEELPIDRDNSGDNQ